MRAALTVLSLALFVGVCYAAEPAGNWTDLVPAAMRLHEFYVAADGKAANDGTKESPWDLTSAFTGKQAIPPGSVVWIRGGVYGKGGAEYLNCPINGREDLPIIFRQYPGERATINVGLKLGNGKENDGMFVWLWGLEITNSSPDRSGSRPGLDLYDRGERVINCAIHDIGHPGIGFWVKGGDGSEVHGALIWGNGFYDNSEHWKGFPRGSGIYTQNQDGKRFITDVIVFRNFTMGLKAYTEGGYCWGYNFIGNISFDNPQWNMEASGNERHLKGLKVIDNMTYRKPGDTFASLYFGYVGRVLDGDFRNNYIVAGLANAPAMEIYNWDYLSYAGNTVYGKTIGVSKTDYPHNTILNERPTKGVKVFTRPNRYEYGRGNIAIYNWEKLPAVEVDISSILPVGAEYEIRDAQNFFGEPLVAGTYDGKPVSIPMNLTAVAMPVGKVPHMIHRYVHTAPEFGAFVALGRGAVGPVASKPATGQLPAPEMLPLGGVFLNTVDVSLSGGNADIRYTTDGTEPTEDSAKYQKPLRLTANTMVKAQAFMAGREKSPVVSARFRVVPEKTPPTITGATPSGRLNPEQKEAVVKVTTDEKAECRFALEPNVEFDDMKEVFALAPGNTSTYTVKGLQPGVVNTLYIKTRDELGNANITDYALSFFVPAGGQPTRIEIEAEKGVLVPPTVAIEDKEAGGGEFVTTPRGDLTGARAAYTFTVPSTDEYVVWARTYSPSQSEDSFLVDIDGQDELVFDVCENKPYKQWRWCTVNNRVGREPAANDPRVFTLSRGEHTLAFKAREPNCRLDKLIITNDRNFKP